MKRTMRFAGIIALSGCLSWLSPLPAMSAPTPERSTELFRTTAAELDLGGDMFLYIEAENAIAGLTGQIAGLVEAVAARTSQADQVRMIIQRVREFLEREGINDLTAYGMSSRPLGDGNYLLKSFVARRPVSPAPRFWRMLGHEPRELSVLRTIPRNAAMFTAMDIRPDEIWAFIQTAVRDIWSEDAYTALRQQVAQIKEVTDLDLDAVVSALSGELALSILLDDRKPVELPLGTETVTIPAPSIVIALGVKNDALMKWLVGKWEEDGAPVEKKSIEGTTVYLAPPNEDMPFPVQFAAAETDGFVLWATHADAISGAISAVRKGNSALNHETVSRLLDRLPRQNNGVTFVDERFNDALLAIHHAQMREADDEVAAEIMSRVMGWFPKGSAVGVRIIKPNGIQTQSVSPMGGKETLMTMAAIPVMMLAGIAMPALMAARDHSMNQRQMLINTLRMVDAAKEQWAMENNVPEGGEVTEENILQYLPNGRIPLPPGHTLRLNPIGENPVIITPDGTEITLP